MKIKNLIDEDFVNYKKPSMFIGFSSCSFKCDKEFGKQICQNSALAAAPSIEMDCVEIAKRFYENPITEAVVFGGLEPFDSFPDMIEMITQLFVCRALYPNAPKPDIVIYTGYYPTEIEDKLKAMKIYNHSQDNIIIKFGRFIPNKTPKFDELLGVQLSSDNQWSEKL